MQPWNSNLHMPVVRGSSSTWLLIAGSSFLLTEPTHFGKMASLYLPRIIEAARVVVRDNFQVWGSRGASRAPCGHGRPGLFPVRLTIE